MNPGAARAITLRRWQKARCEIERLGIKANELVTRGPGEATEVTRRALMTGTERIVAVGGDGTLNEVVNGYWDQSGGPINPEATIGILPSGTGSDFRKSLGIFSMGHAISAITGDSTRLVDAGRATLSDENGRVISRYFINLASIGFGARVVEIVSRWRHSLPWWIGGRARFLLAAGRALRQYRNVAARVRLDDENDLSISSNLIVVAIGRFAGGGMMLAPNARIDDGLFDVLLVDGASRLDVLKELPRIRRGGHLKNPRVREERARKVEITSGEPMAIELDGECVGITPAQISILPSVVRFAVLGEQGWGESR